MGRKLAPNNLFKPNPLRRFVQMCRCSIEATHRLGTLWVGLIQVLGPKIMKIIRAKDLRLPALGEQSTSRIWVVSPLVFI